MARKWSWVCLAPPCRLADGLFVATHALCSHIRRDFVKCWMRDPNDIASLMLEVQENRSDYILFDARMPEEEKKTKKKTKKPSKPKCTGEDSQKEEEEEEKVPQFRALAYMSEAQLELLQRYGQGRPMLMDSTHNSNYHKVGCGHP